MERGKGMTHSFNFKATGIGSVPSRDIRESCLNILKHLPNIPFWPQMVKRSPVENMHIQFSEGLPLLSIDKERGSLAVTSDNRETALVEFYEHFLADETAFFALSREYAPGLFELVEMVSQNPGRFGAYIKGQTVGPVTFAAGITGDDDKNVLSDTELVEALTKGLAIKALWQVRELAKSGKQTIIFLDEPYLSGFGSAFSPIERHDVIGLLKEVIDYVRERSEALIGIHCCGNTDWSMIVDSGPDIISFDAFSFLDYFLLYPEHIMEFLKGGGFIAWGIVPTFEFTGEETVEGLYSKLEEGLKRLREFGLEPEVVIERSILTPACGMGTMEPASSQRVFELLSMLSEKMKP
jgi:methionine synthase II (cobalamin-independent)